MKRGSIVWLGSIVFVMMQFISVSRVLAQEPCVTQAWDAFNDKDFVAAIALADGCIDDFGRAAYKVQRELDSLGIPLPPTGKVSAAERDQIFKRGLLNDVATACWIKGRAAEHLCGVEGLHQEEYRVLAEEAYARACEYGHGRTWDERGWFWSPCEAANERLPLDE